MRPAPQMTAGSAWTIDDSEFPRTGPFAERARFLLRYAVLAPSSHNTQPWLFRIDTDSIDLYLDERRWLRVADPDRRELHVSVGCALENLLVAGEHFELHGDVQYFPDPAQPTLAARVTWVHAPAMSFWRPPELFDAILARHTTHRPYDLRPLGETHRQALLEMVAEPGLSLRVLADANTRQALDDLIAEADARQFADPAWREELGYWMRQGVFGNGWLMSRLASLSVRYLDLGRGLGRHDVERADSAACFAGLLLDRVSPTGWLRVGQAFERLALRATHLGIRVQPMSQVLQLPALRDRLARLVDAPQAPQLLFRLGYAEAEGHTPRRPLADVIVDGPA